MSDKPPNIVFFFWDNFGWGALEHRHGEVDRVKGVEQSVDDGPGANSPTTPVGRRLWPRRSNATGRS